MFLIHIAFLQDFGRRRRSFLSIGQHVRHGGILSAFSSSFFYIKNLSHTPLA